MDDFGDLLDLRARLEAFSSEGRSRLVPLIGSGPSNAVLPDVKHMTLLFRDAIPESGRSRFDEIITPILGTALGYQNAASLVKRQAGDPAMARTVRRAVLGSCPGMDPDAVEALSHDIEACRDLELTEVWQIPPAYRGLAECYASLEGRQRGPILTTNFDPLIEIALREVGLSCSPVSVTADQVPTGEQLRNQTGIPVIHLHGYWTSNAALSTIPQLTRPRPALEGLLQGVFRNGTILVLGYSGWEDAFMRSLATRVRDNELDLLEAEVLWGAFSASSEDLLRNSLLSDLCGSPGFTVYLGIDAHKVFGQTQPAPLVERDTTSPYGFSLLPTLSGSHEPLRFAEGGQPSWSDAGDGVWPMLDSTKQLAHALEVNLQAGGGGGTIALGPMGEGKSLAIRQVARHLAEKHASWSFLWREPGAPRITVEWIRETRLQHPRLVLCVDDADLVGAELVATREAWAQQGSGVALLLASQDRLWWSVGATLRDQLESVLFHGLNPVDAEEIARAWVKNGVLPAGVAGETTISEYSDRLTRSAAVLLEGDQATLFGAILDVRHGDQLAARVSDQMHKLFAINPVPGSKVSLGEIFGGVCLLQDTFDRYGHNRKGASRAMIASMAGLPTVFADGKILDQLGREAAIAFAGGHVYARHPAIARAAVDYLRLEGQAPSVARAIGRAGGQLRSMGGLPDEQYRQAYLLSRSLKIREEALAAAVGAVEGASDLLEPRVTLIRVKRQFDIDDADIYSRGVAAHIQEFRDYGHGVRAFLNEYSQVKRRQGEAQFALGLAALGLHDGTGFSLDAKRAKYLLTSVAVCATTVSKQSRVLPASVVAGTRVLLERIVGGDAASSLMQSVPYDDDAISSARKLSTSALCNRLGSALSAAANTAHLAAKLSYPFDGTLRLNDLGRLAETRI